MKLLLSAEEKAFEAEVKEFLASKLPAELSEKVHAGAHISKEEHVQWQKILYEQGWAAENWPYEHGGTGWNEVQKYIWANELAAAGAPDVIPFGISMVAPVIYTHGTEEQKQRFLPDILASDTWWCQGYSEPEAGSDLSSLQTTAHKDGENYVINGTKTWITFAQHADWIFCLARTGPESVKNSDAISFFLIPMDSKGITVSPIITMDGYHEMNEVRFEQVQVSGDNRIGEEGEGWNYAKFVLNHERAKLAHVAKSRSRLKRLKEDAQAMSEANRSMMDDAYFAAKVAKLEIELNALELMEFNSLLAKDASESPGPESSILKIVGAEITQSIDELFVELAGLHALPKTDDAVATDKNEGLNIPASVGNATSVYLNNRKASLFGGSSEIQKNIICKEFLGLDQDYGRDAK